MAENTAKTAPAAKAEKRTREKVLSKDDFVSAFQANLEGRGIKVSKAKAWGIFKLGLATAFDLGAVTPLSLSGVGRFGTIISKRSEDKGKPAKRMRFRPSSRVNDLINEGKKCVDDLEPAEAETETTEGKATEAAPATAAATPATTPATEAGAVELI